ncbi:hypothetical protein KSF_073490 [Reticulibacter mediterranei]|uniref:FAD-binding PCMH-type domain-containing protein n=1 Tax=Reticulibacter mediterranei TaxID=2778369 RepID=A0A8J3IMH2_9CHLR|nr:FAD-binding oxidoreductase [Reticulibacter mediterranei]GHO97301.1 hypothetical protein KSF_073490 [Reticulibacter mediterranei]
MKQVVVLNENAQTFVQNSNVHSMPMTKIEIDVEALERDLRAKVRGEVRFFDEGSRALYTTDASNYRQVPIGVVIPKDTNDVVAAVAACRQYAVPPLARGGGTSLAGQCCNVAVVLDMPKYMNNIIELDQEQRRARVRPGFILDHLRNAAEKYHLTFGPDPATHNHCTLGVMIGNNSCGVHALTITLMSCCRRMALMSLELWSAASPLVWSSWKQQRDWCRVRRYAPLLCLAMLISTAVAIKFPCCCSITR